jgi:hypothetical protein
VFRRHRNRASGETVDGTHLAEVSPAEQAMLDHDKIVELTRVPLGPDATFIVARLNAEGIRAVKGAGDGVFGLFYGAYGQGVAIYVFDHDLERAQAFLTDVYEPALAAARLDMANGVLCDADDPVEGAPAPSLPSTDGGYAAAGSGDDVPGA